MSFTVEQLVQLFLTFCGAVITIGGAGAIVIKVKGYFKKPDIERDKQLKKHSEQLDNDNKRLKQLEEGNKVIMQALIALMSHELDGNHKPQLEEAKKNIEQYLIHR